MRFIRPLIMAAGLMMISSISSAQSNFYRNLGDCKELPVLVEHGAGQIYKLTQDEVERSLVCLARVSGKEDSWLYDGVYLYDNGINEQPSGVGVDFSFTYEYIVPSSMSDNLVSYHIHPMSTSEFSISPSSIKDIVFHMRESFEMSKYGKTIMSSVADGFGIWQYNIEPNENFMFECDWEKNFTLTTFAVINSLDELMTCLESFDISDEERTYKFIDEMAKFGVSLTYMPLDDIK